MAATNAAERRRYWSRARVALLIEDYENGWGYAPLGDAHGCSGEQIRSVLVAQGIPLRKAGQPVGINSEKRPAIRSTGAQLTEGTISAYRPTIRIGFPLDKAAKEILSHYGPADAKVLAQLIMKGLEGKLNDNRRYRDDAEARRERERAERSVADPLGDRTFAPYRNGAGG